VLWVRLPPAAKHFVKYSPEILENRLWGWYISDMSEVWEVLNERIRDSVRLYPSERSYEMGRELYANRAAEVDFLEGPDLYATIDEANLAYATGKVRLTWDQLSEFYGMPEFAKPEMAAMLDYQLRSDRNYRNSDLILHSGESRDFHLVTSLRSTPTQAFQWSVYNLVGGFPRRDGSNSTILDQYADRYNMVADRGGIVYKTLFVPNEYGFAEPGSLVGRKIKFGRLLCMNPDSVIPGVAAAEIFRGMGLKTKGYEWLKDKHSLDLHDMLTGDFRKDSRYLRLPIVMLSDGQRRGDPSDVAVHPDNAKSLDVISRIKFERRPDLDKFLGKTPEDADSPEGQFALKGIIANGHRTLLMETEDLQALPSGNAAIVEAGRPHYKFVETDYGVVMAVFAGHFNSRLYDPGTPVRMRKELILPHVTNPDHIKIMQSNQCRVAIWVGLTATRSGMLKAR
jgi:hypothetical protein